MTTLADPPEDAPHTGRRNPAPRILLAVGIALLAYYTIVVVSGALSSESAVPVDGQQPRTSEDYLLIQMKIQDVDLGNRVIQANLLPVAHGTFDGERPGEVARTLRIEASSGGVTTSVVTFPGDSIVDPTAMTLTLDRGDTAYPFDSPFTNLRVSVQDDKTQADVPFRLAIENGARPWNMHATLGSPTTAEGRRVIPVQIDGSRDALSVTLVLFYMIAILLTTLMAVVTIGSAILNRVLGFENVIWLSATMISFPALRSSAPGAPPIGTALDFIVFFPCFCLVAAMLLWTGAYLLWRESALLRTR